MVKFKKYNQLILLVTMIASLAVITNFIMQLSVFSRQVEEVALNNAIHKTKEREGIIQSFIIRAKDTILALRHSLTLQKFVENSAWKNPFTQLAVDVASSNRDIKSISFIDPSGAEQVHIARYRPDSSPVISADANLHDRSQHDYFDMALKTPHEAIWFSKLDLSKDNEQFAIETLRVLLPVSQQGELKGILSINYYMQDLLKTLFSAPLYNMILADASGNILLHYDKDKSWSQYKKGEGLKDNLIDFKNVLKSKAYRSDKFFSRQLDLPLHNQLILILSLNQDYIEKQKEQFVKNGIYSGVTTIVIALIFALALITLFKRFFKEYDVRAKKIHSLVELNQQINGLLDKNKAYMEMASDGVHIMNMQGELVAFSQSFSSMLGYSEQELSTFSICDWDTSMSQSQIVEKLSSVTAKATKFETKHKCKNGEIIEVEVNIKAIFVAGEKLIYASSRDVSQRKQAQLELEKLASTDFLTKLPCRRMFDKRLEEELARCQRTNNYTATVVMLDVDNFKEINDSFGHIVGDMALKHIANTLDKELRKVDFIARFGGDEFGIILIDSNEVDARKYLDRIRLKVEQNPLIIEENSIAISISIGIAMITPDENRSETILKKADQALYRAKKLGRNRLEVY